MTSIDLNCDMGELVHNLSENLDDQIMPYISSCNIACGFHSGNPLTIERTIVSAKKHKVKVGAHPSYDDPVNFGRKTIDIKKEKLLADIRYQVSAVKGMCESLGISLHHVKAHGALYHDILKDQQLNRAYVETIKSIDPELKIYGLANSELEVICKQQQMTFVAEGFADRVYETNNRLRSRAMEHSVLHDKENVLDQVKMLLEGKVKLHSGAVEDLRIETLCLHSDTPGAVGLSKEINKFIQSENVIIG